MDTKLFISGWLNIVRNKISSYFQIIVHIVDVTLCDFLQQRLTLVLLNCFNCIFLHLKLELLTQFPASNENEKKWKKDMSKIKLLDELSIY